MPSNINAIVVGAGKFGRHYVRILSRLNAESHLGIPPINRLIITRTKRSAAESMARQMMRDPLCRVSEVIGTRVRNARELEDLARSFAPVFICITARDPAAGDDIHAAYTLAALPWGPVLCEKPFCHAAGDGQSLSRLQALEAAAGPSRFGLELPMAVVARHIRRSPAVAPLWRRPRHMVFLWQIPAPGKVDILDDLALHPWSLLPADYRIDTVAAAAAGSARRIELTLVHAKHGDACECRIMLQPGGTFRKVTVDGSAIGIHREKDAVELIPIDRGPATNGRARREAPLLRVDNPLKENIVALLRGKPLIDAASTHRSQLFLERLHGYVPGEHESG